MMRKLLTFLKVVIIFAFMAGCGETGKEVTPEVTPEIKLPGGVQSTEISIKSESQSVTVSFTSNVPWKASVSADWIFISPSSGQAGSKTVSIKVMENTTDQPRTATVTITDIDGKSTLTFVINQEAMVRELALNPESMTFSAQGGEDNLTVSSNTDWTVSKDVDWITLNSDKGSGDFSLKVTVNENQGLTARTGSITVTTADGKINGTVAVQQAGADVVFSIDKQDVSVNADGEVFTVSVTHNIGYKIDSKPDWVKQTDKTTSGSTDTYTFKAEANTSTAAREGVIVFCNDNNECVPVTVKQTGANATLSASPAELAFSATAGSKVFSITSNTLWTATSSASWAKLNKTSGSGNAQVTVTVEVNNMGIARTATITIKTTNGKTVAINVTQDAADLILKIDKYSFYVESEGGTIKLKVTHNVDYTISKPDWISLATKTTNGDTDTLTFNVLRNSGFKREENIIFATYNSRTFVSVTQHGSKKNGSNDDTTTGSEIIVE